MNQFHHRLNAVAARMSGTAMLDTELRDVVEATAQAYGVSAEELLAETRATLAELAAAGATITEERVRFICRRDGIPEDEVWAALRGEG